MIIFISGVHGVGKSYLANQFVACHDWFFTSASDLIKKGKSANWGNDKKVKDILTNQDILIAELKSIQEEHNNIIIDGHAALINSNAEIELINPSVFGDLNIDGIILLEQTEEVIRNRFASRGLGEISYNLPKLIKAEREQIRKVSIKKGIPLIELFDADLESFKQAVLNIQNKKR